MNLPSGPSRALLGAWVGCCLFFAACAESDRTPVPALEPVSSAELPRFSYPERVLLAERGVALPAQVPAVVGPAAILSWSLEGKLPAGIVFDSVDGTISGTAAETASPRTLVVTAGNRRGSFRQELSLSVSEALSLAQVGAAAGDAIEGLLALAHNRYLLLSEGRGAPLDIQVDPLGRLAYSLRELMLTPYVIDTRTRTLVRGEPVSLGEGPHSLFVHPGGEYVYLASAAQDSLRAYAVDASGGSLSWIEEVATGGGPTDIAGDPNGRYLVVGHETGEVLESFTIDADTGRLAFAGRTELPTVRTRDIEMGPLGESLYVVLRHPFEGLLRCVVDTSTGVARLGPLNLAGSAPLSLSIEPGRRFAYVLNEGSENITYYSVSTENGTLTRIGELPSTAGTVSLRFSRDGERAVAVDIQQQVARLYVRESSGSLTQIGALPLEELPMALVLFVGTQGPTPAPGSWGAPRRSSEGESSGAKPPGRAGVPPAGDGGRDR